MDTLDERIEMALFDAGERLIAASDAFRERLGSRREASRTLAFRNLIAARDAGMLAAFMASGAADWAGYLELLTGDDGEQSPPAIPVSARLTRLPMAGEDATPLAMLHLVAVSPDRMARTDQAHRDATGQVAGAVLCLRDLNAEREARRRLLQASAVYASTSEGVLITDPRVRIVEVNDAFTRITGYPAAEVIGQTPRILDSRWHPRGFFSAMWRQLRRERVWRGEIWNRRKDGEIVLQHLTIRRILDERGRTLNYVVVFAALSANEDQPQAVQTLAHNDPLTRLPNRLLFASRLDHAIDLCRRKRTAMALVLVDLDRFAHVNTSLGHPIGDEVLRLVATRLRASIRQADTLARLGGNLFGLLFEDIAREAQAVSIAELLRGALRAPIEARDHQVFVTASIGIAFARAAEALADRMMTHAETALRQAKTAGRDRIVLFGSAAIALADDPRQRVERLLEGFERHEFILFFRPRVNLEDELWIGAEATIRWQQPDGAPIPPERFMSRSDDGGLMLKLDEWVLHESCRQARDWLSRGIPFGRVAVPLTETLLLRGEAVRLTEQALAATGLPAYLLELDLSESLLARHQERSSEVLNGLCQLGVSLTLSEVGTGCIPPALLRRLPIETLMMHPCFVEALPDSHDDLAIVQALVSVAQALDLNIVADGVRTNEQRLILLNIGCAMAQGPLFAAPVGRGGFESLLRKRPEPRVFKQLES